MIRLQKFSREHFDNLISWIENEEDLMQFAGPTYSFPLTIEQIEKSLEDERRFAFHVVKVDTNQDIGYCELYLKENSIHLGRILVGNTSLRGQGIGQQIVAELLEFGFNNFDRTVAELNVFDWNNSAIKCYQKVGFKINPNKKMKREINSKTWAAINMIIEKATWRQHTIK